MWCKCSVISAWCPLTARHTLLWLQSVVRVAFHDRRLQSTEQQQLAEWRWSWPGNRILDVDVPLSLGVIAPQVLPSQLNTVEFHWDPTKRTSLFLQQCSGGSVGSLMDEKEQPCSKARLFKKGGEKGVPFRLLIDTFRPSDKGLPPDHLHLAGCLIKPKGADRKLKTDGEKLEKQPMHERDKYQTACESTVFLEVHVLGFQELMPSRLPVLPCPGPSPPPSLCAPSALPPPPAATPGQLFLGHSPLPQAQQLINLLLRVETPSTCQGLGQLLIYRWEQRATTCIAVCLPTVFAMAGVPCKTPVTSQLSGSDLSPLLQASVPREELNHRASISETQQWLYQHRFSSYCQMLANFTGLDLLKLTSRDLIQICGVADGIRLFNTIRARCWAQPISVPFPLPIHHRLTLYVAQEASRQENEVPKNPDSVQNPDLGPGELHCSRLMARSSPETLLKCLLTHQAPGEPNYLASYPRGGGNTGWKQSLGELMKPDAKLPHRQLSAPEIG
ncbi:hypothetical protein P7K49_011571 [Saguinus oedipus]|uniref:Grh/CP2 DB domain-containing protein n=1 Tax=Saguinus oedipus TaxID=9490 RepID=A0ABQ9VRR6_SAGOE|nr:hypothetical protein P7K49_011571 [Saguinus oedipus]